MNRPTMKREVAIDSAIGGSVGIIYLYASPDSLTDLGGFGAMVPWNAPDFYQLRVDRRFDFDEVEAYIRAYGQEGDDLAAYEDQEGA